MPLLLFVRLHGFAGGDGVIEPYSTGGTCVFLFNSLHRICRKSNRAECLSWHSADRVYV